MTIRVRLRSVDPNDLAVFFEHQCDAEANRMAAFPARDRVAFDAHWERNILGNPDAITQTILVDGDVAGHIGSWQLDGARYVGYWIGQEYWGHGVATQALRAFVERIVERPLYAHVVKHNVGSIRVLEKCGFQSAAETEATADATHDEIVELLFALR